MQMPVALFIYLVDLGILHGYDYLAINYIESANFVDASLNSNLLISVPLLRQASIGISARVEL